MFSHRALRLVPSQLVTPSVFLGFFRGRVPIVRLPTTFFFVLSRQIRSFHSPRRCLWRLFTGSIRSLIGVAVHRNRSRMQASGRARM